VTLAIVLDGSDIGTTRVRLRGSGGDGIAGLNAAANGETSMGGIVFEDPASDFAIQGWMPITVDEPDCTAAPRLFTGYVADRKYSRGPYRAAASHQVDTTINDTMVLMSFLLITGTDGKRPAETHIERIDWLLGSSYIPGGLVTDLGLVDRSTPRPFEEADYRGQYPAEVLSDLAGPIFRTWFTYWDQSAESIGLFFDTPGSTTNTSTLAISNDLDDVDDSTTFAPYVDGALAADPSEVYAKIRYTYRNGTIIENSSTTRDAYFPDLGYRGLQVNNDRVGLESTARNMADNLLTKYSQEAEVLTFTVRLPSTHVGLIDAGMRLPVKFTHLPGYETSTYVRVEQRTTMQTEGQKLFYDVELTCSNHGLTIGGGGTSGGGGGGGGGIFPAPPPAPAVHEWSGHYEGFTEYYSSSRPVGFGTSNTTLVTGDGPITIIGSDGMEYTWHADVTIADGGWMTHMGVATVPGDEGVYTELSVHPPGGAYSGAFDGSGTVHGASGTYWFATQGNAPGHAVVAMTTDWWVDSAGWVTGGSSDPPVPGQPVLDETPTPDPDGMTTVFTTVWPYADRSLHVEMNGSELDSGVDFTESAPATGEFTFTRPPLADAQIIVWYQGR
jgi:hypothetical protein